MAKTFWLCPEFENRKQIGDLEKKMNLLKQKNECTIFSFTGCRGREGVSTIVVNLANYMIRFGRGKKTLVVDANFLNPVLHHGLSQSLGTGLSDVLKGTTPWSDAVTGTESDNIHFLSCGGGFQQMAGEIEQEQFVKVISEIKKMYDFVVIDSAPLLTSADSLTAAVAADATFLVIQAMKTPKEVGERAKSLLQDNEILIGGVLLNRLKQVIPGWMYKIL